MLLGNPTQLVVTQIVTLLNWKPLVVIWDNCKNLWGTDPQNSAAFGGDFPMFSNKISGFTKYIAKR
jgi:hypothetical protein